MLLHTIGSCEADAGIREAAHQVWDDAQLSDLAAVVLVLSRIAEQALGCQTALLLSPSPELPGEVLQIYLTP